jgi:sugar lactone lactonase YvrE
MKQIFKTFAAAALSSLMLCSQVLAGEVVWTASGLNMPESVEYDAIRNRFYVSNVAGGVMEQDGNGSIGLIDGSGKLINTNWVTGLHSPKGLALHKDKLYVADVKQLVVVNVDEGKVVARYEMLDSKVLNGIAISNNGDVFVSDWIGNRIYTLQDGELKLWLESPDLNSPNGLWVEGANLYVASWGRNPRSDFSTETSGRLLRVALSTKTIETSEGESQWINMDGIAGYSRGRWLISDFIKGEVLLLNRAGQIEKTVATLKKGAADFYYLEAKHLIVVPLFMDNQVVAYRLED